MNDVMKKWVAMLILELILASSLASRHQRRRMAMKMRFRQTVMHPHIPIPPWGGGGGNNTPEMLFSVEKVLRDGLLFAGFSDDRIAKCGEIRILIASKHIMEWLR